MLLDFVLESLLLVSLLLLDKLRLLQGKLLLLNLMRDFQLLLGGREMERQWHIAPEHVEPIRKVVGILQLGLCHLALEKQEWW